MYPLFHWLPPGFLRSGLGRVRARSAKKDFLERHNAPIFANAPVKRNHQRLESRRSARAGSRSRDASSARPDRGTRTGSRLGTAKGWLRPSVQPAIADKARAFRGVQRPSRSASPMTLLIAIIPARPQPEMVIRDHGDLDRRVPAYFAADSRMAMARISIAPTACAQISTHQIDTGRTATKKRDIGRWPWKFDPDGARRSCNVGSFVASGKRAVRQGPCCLGGAAMFDQK